MASVNTNTWELGIATVEAVDKRQKVSSDQELAQSEVNS